MTSTSVRSRCASWCASAPWSAGREVALRDAAARMEEQGVSSILVDLGDGELGIVTDRDLRSRVVAAGLPVETAVGEIMTTPVVTVRPEQTGDELMLLMIDRGIRHVPVVSSAGELMGVATDLDLLANETHTPILLRRAIGDATDTAGLRATIPQLRSTLIAMHAAGLVATRISGVLSVVVDALVRRLIELTVDELGPPPAEFGWLSLGSFGRREAVPSSDADSGMAWADGAEPDAAAYCIASRAPWSTSSGLWAGRPTSTEWTRPERWPRARSRTGGARSPGGSTGTSPSRSWWRSRSSSTPG